MPRLELDADVGKARTLITYTHTQNTRVDRDFGAAKCHIVSIFLSCSLLSAYTINTTESHATSPRVHDADISTVPHDVPAVRAVAFNRNLTEPCMP